MKKVLVINKQNGTEIKRIENITGAEQAPVLVSPDTTTLEVVSATGGDRTIKQEMSNLTIGISTRFNDSQVEEYIEHLKETIGIDQFDIIVKYNVTGIPLTKVYNEIINETDTRYLVMMHDDLIFVPGDNWGQKILDSLTNTEYGIIGLAGTSYMPSNGCFWQGAGRTAGVVKHVLPNKQIEVSKFSGYQGNHIIPVVSCDGLFIAADLEKIKCKFDETFDKFHFYDHSFCTENYILGCKVGVLTNIDITHKSKGHMDNNWSIENRKYINKFAMNPLTKLPLLPIEEPPVVLYDTNELNTEGMELEKYKISIIIPSKDRNDLLFKCVNSIIEKTSHKNYEIIVADTGSSVAYLEECEKFCREKKVKVVNYNYYNFSKINNDVVRNHMDRDSELILFCNNDIELLNDAITRMLMTYHTNKKTCGTVGARLHFANGLIQHNGMLLVQDKKTRTIAPTHSGFGFAYRNDYETAKVCPGSTGAFLMVNRKDFFRVGMFNENYIDCYQDVELNLAIYLLDKTNYINEQAVCYHFESQTRNNSSKKDREQQRDHSQVLTPYMNKNLPKIRSLLTLM